LLAQPGGEAFDFGHNFGSWREVRQHPDVTLQFLQRRGGNIRRGDVLQSLPKISESLARVTPSRRGAAHDCLERRKRFARDEFDFEVERRQRDKCDLHVRLRVRSAKSSLNADRALSPVESDFSSSFFQRAMCKRVMIAIQTSGCFDTKRYQLSGAASGIKRY
jgi:hypothetical protein